MSVITGALSLLLALQQAAPPPAARTCPTGDNRCKAELFVRRAKDEATPPEHRAKYLLGAHRLYLGLYDKTGEDRDLCAARRSLDQLRKAHADSPGLPAALAELDTRERARRPRCVDEREPRPRSAGLRVARAAPPPKSQDASEPAAPSGPAAQPVSVATQQAADDLLPLGAYPQPVRPRPEMRREAPAMMLDQTPPGRATGQAVPGRRLAISGGLTLGAGLILGGVAAYAGARAAEARKDGFAFQETPVDAEDAVAFDRDAELRADYGHKANLALGTAVAGGAAIVVGAVLLGLGARQLARRTSQAALLPAPGGLVWRARF
jgi:hypothetical protein